MSHLPAATTPPEPAGAANISPARRSWHRLTLAGRPRATRANVFAAVLALALGFAIAVQVRQTSIEGLEGLREDDLVRILSTVNQDGARLTDEIATLQVARDQLLSATDNSGAVRAAQERLDALGILAGTVGAQGPGVTVTITAPEGKYTAAMMLDAIQELRDAGAEVIQVNTVRVVASTWFADAGADISVSGTTIVQPYVLLAIGDPKTLASAMGIPGGVVDNAARVNGAAEVTTKAQVRITALHPVSSPRYAQPVPEASPSK